LEKTHTHTHTLYIYIYREREREIERFGSGSFGTKEKGEKKSFRNLQVCQKKLEKTPPGRKIQTDMHEGLIEGRSMHAMIWLY
jgi:hypothetical protein